MSELQSMNPEEAVEMYIETRKGDTADATVQKHRYRLQKFLEWCGEADVDDTTQLNGRNLHKFRLWRKEDGELAKVSLRSQLSSIRTFIRFCENVDAVEQDLHKKIELPDVSPEESSRDTVLEPERAEKIQTFLQRFRYATREHALFELLWRTGVRIGTARSLDLEDFEEEEERLRIRHRAESGTPLKNAERAERYIAISTDLTAILSDWIAQNRPEVTDDHGREPLFASSRGRCSKSTLRRTVYRVSQPCYYGDSCPHDREPSDCAAEGYAGGQKCPSSVDPHTIRRGAITHFLSEDVPEKVVSDRMNVSGKVLERHYDKRSEERKTEQRRQFLSNV
ncbi:tyrosine-type recombinase/integrase [Halorarum halobium]|uniref:tyrosine-type recombinase/integrase n=1 Tax=Halorarum halobium TaxID=3075121 RepID=UPI0028AD4F14|nr:tyrosine-type recombinase/integrase [Halobaculum sp. XH14]